MVTPQECDYLFLSGDLPEIFLHLLLQQFQSVLQSTTLHQEVHLN